MTRTNRFANRVILALIGLLALVAAALPGRAAASPQERGRWREPLPGARVVAPFTFDRVAPYARGARRGIDLRGHPGGPVLAACGGTVVFAGALPGRRGGVTAAGTGRVGNGLAPSRWVGSPPPTRARAPTRPATSAAAG